MVREGLLLRLLAVAPITLLGLIAGVRRWPQTLAFCVGASPIAFMAVIIHLSLYLPPEYAARYLVATVLVVGLGNIMLPYSLRGLLVYDGSAILVAMAVLAANDSAGLLNYLDYLILLALVGAATLPIAHRYESLRQHNFLLNLRARIVSHELFNANQALHILSESDPLTGIANRRCFEREFDELVAASRAAAAYSEQDRIAVMMIDLDYFKSFNDTHGHQAGDACLCLVANSLQSLFDEAGGIVARYGGEEFIAAFCVTDTGTAQTLGEEVRETIATVLMPVSEQDRSLVTASIGVGIAPVAADLPREELIEMADAALYSAKGRGRNRVEWTEAEIAFSRGV
jgi:diguanylate cyclase (GGDEF)-like protein